MWLLKAGGCLIQFKYISLRILGQLSSGCLIQVGCLIEVTTNTGLTVYATFNDQCFNDTLTNDIVSFEQLGPYLL